MGTAVIRAPTYQPAELGVSVFTPLERTINIHIIGDNAGHVPNITQSQATTFFNEANTIWKSQANISFGPNPIIRAPKILDANFGEYVDFIDGETDAVSVILSSEYNDAVEINVFIVYDLAHNGNPVDGLALTNPNDQKPIIFIPHNAETMKALAHELGHALGLREDEGDADYEDEGRKYQLMWYKRGSGTTIVPSQGRTIHGMD